MRVSNAVRHIEHIATLRLAPHIAIPEMLRALDGILPDAQTGFFWVDGNGAILDAYVPSAPQLTDAHIDERIVAGAGALFHYQQGGAFQMTVRVGGRVRAILSMRRLYDSAFTERERRILSTLAPCFSQALESVPAATQVFDEVADRSGILVATTLGRLVSADEDAMPLLIEMMDQPLTPGTRSPCCDEPLPRFLIDLMQRKGAPAAPASQVLQKTSRWGAYRARVFSQMTFCSDDGEPKTHAIMLSRHLPRTVRLMRTIEACDLSPRERQAAFQLGIGADAGAAAAALGISITTWRGYVKRVYQRLDVRDRVELMNRFGTAAAVCTRAPASPSR